MRSDSVVKSRMSLNRMHTSASWPLTPGERLPASISFITAGLTCPAKVRRRRPRSTVFSMPSTMPRVTTPAQSVNTTDATGTSNWCSRMA